MKQPRDKLAQILPAVRRMPKLPIETAWASALTDLVVKAMVANGRAESATVELGDEPIASLFAPARAQFAAEFYVSAKQNQTSLPNFRKMVDREKKHSLAAAVDHFLSLIQHDSQPPFPQMEALYCNADPAIDGLDKSGGDVEGSKETPHCVNPDDYDDDRREPARIWREKYSPTILKLVLIEWRRLLVELSKRAGSGPAPGRSPIEAEIMFVSMLAAYWSGELRLPVSSGRGAPAPSNDHDQQGLFANFVRICAEIIPEDFRPRSWDHAIRITCGEKT
jgi:hypothetical protein